MNSLLPIGVCVFPDVPANYPRGNGYAHYIHEVLAHAGLGYSTLEATELEDALSQIRLLVTVGEGVLSDSTKEQLCAWCQKGGAWLSIAGTSGLGDLFGVQNTPQVHDFVAYTMMTLGEGYLAPEVLDHPALGHLEIPLHFYNGFSVIPAAGTDAIVVAGTSSAHQTPSPRCGIVEREVGAGRCFLIAPDAIGAIARIQQGVAITRDGVPAPDGSAPVTDRVLKCDDGAVLDWEFDRQPIPEAPGLKGFLQPVADQWRELLLRSIFHLAKEQEIALPLLWLYPRNLPAIAHMSFDSDGNDPERAGRLLEVLEEADIATTWCIILPGYGAELTQRIHEAGHELATHYDALDHPWGEDSFDAQWRALCAQFSEPPVSNKNHYTRWEGDTEFFDWCEQRGIRLDQSKGPSKVGEIGMIFGSCHPHFPLAPDGRVIDVLELPFFTQDLEIFAPSAVRGALRATALKAHGVLHMLFHPAHIAKPGVADALLNTVREAKAVGMEWWTARQINNWERARRSTRWTPSEASGATLRCEHTLPEATLCFFNPRDVALSINGSPIETQTVMRWGFEFQAVVLEIEAGDDYSLDF
jgi:hypothetical protein